MCLGWALQGCRFGQPDLGTALQATKAMQPSLPAHVWSAAVAVGRARETYDDSVGWSEPCHKPWSQLKPGIKSA
jgi:hypothetical protein